ncbi:MAG: hypothetical protein GVY10_05820 [Verrucomicrobia bacterium]|nr:hypothetical protein [Verrucomicrobiota bacterium]
MARSGGFRSPDGVRLVLDEHNFEHGLLDRMARRDRWSFRSLFHHYEVLRFCPEEIEFVRRADHSLNMVGPTRFRMPGADRITETISRCNRDIDTKV